MALNAEDEILQDFLVEAGEILEQLGEQLVDLEQQPGDFDLLNAVFRGFHTIKGGAGFLGIEAMVEVCHCAEDVFNVLRQGQRTVDPHLMDTVLQVLDVVNDMFALVREGEELEPADRKLIDELRRLALAEDDAADTKESNQEIAREPELAAAAEEGLAAEIEPIAVAADAAAASKQNKATGKQRTKASAEVFDELLEALQETEPTPAATNSDDITEDEFEELLDKLHGKGKHSGVPQSNNTAPTSTPNSPPASPVSDEITEDEFEELLDQIHGKGKHGNVPLPANGKGVAQKPSKHPATKAKQPTKQQSVGKKAASKKPVNKAPTAKQTTPAVKPKVAADSAGKANAGSGSSSKGIVDKVKAGAAETTVRVDTQRLDDIMNMVGELVLVRNRLATLKATVNDEQVATAVSSLDVVTSDLQISVMKTRMQPIKKVFGRFPRVVRDLARSLHKEIDLQMEGEETDLDKNLVEALADPLVHLVRNSVDHGIESPEDREQAGKPRKGTVMLSAAQEGDHIQLAIEDDGKGMDPEKLRKKAVEKGMMDGEAAARLDHKECYNLIFAPGFSTKTEISDVSGRGVGMDVVKTRIAQMNGSVEIDSEFGKGTRIAIKLPLTLAILPTLMVILGNQPFALPLASVVEIFNLDLQRTNTVDGQLTIRVRDRALPLFYLRQWLVKDQVGISEYSDGHGHVVVVNVGNLQVGLVVDHLIGQEEVVIKPLGALLQGLEGMAGATITGDGKIALILDVPGLMRKYARRY